MTSQYRLRKAIAGDAATIVSWFPTHDSAVLWGGPEVPANLTPDWMAAQFDDPARRYCVLVDDRERVCGCYALREFPQERRLHIGRFGVAPDLRGRGLGSLMIERAIALARESNAQKLTLYVYDENRRARRLYERSGFVDAAMTNGREFPGASMALMERMLDPI